MSAVSIVIRCGDDPSVLRCIDSIDTEAQVVVPFTGSESLAARIGQTGAICVPAPPSNLSRISNVGVAAATNERIIITDSDTWFGPGCIGRLSAALDKSKVARARLRFDGRGQIGQVVAEARDYVNSLPLVYTPGIAVRRDLLPDVGGFLFNDPVPYAVDADLNFRIQRSHVPVDFVDDAWVHHGPVTLRHDLRAAHRIGRGCRTSMDHWNRDRRFGSVDPLTLKGVKPVALPHLLRRKGPRVLFYQLLWDSAFWTGFWRGVREAR